MGVAPRAESANAGVYLFVPYHADFIDRLKARVPARSRAWDGDDKSWYVFRDYAEDAVTLAQEYWPHLDLTLYKASAQDQRQRHAEGWEYNATKTKRRWIDASGFQGPWIDAPRPTWNGQGTSYQQPMTFTSDQAVLYVLDTAPPEVIRAAYKALANLYHPDKGGSVEKMQKINVAFDNLKEAKKA